MKAMVQLLGAATESPPPLGRYFAAFGEVRFLFLNIVIGTELHNKFAGVIADLDGAKSSW
jgi:hypothetical protein